MKKTLLAGCLQADLVGVTIKHHTEFLGEDIDVWFLPGIIRKFIENQSFLEKLKEYQEIYFTGHEACGYYDLKGFQGKKNEDQQVSDIEEISDLLSQNSINCQSEFIRVSNQQIFLNGSKYPKKHQNDLVEMVLMYPVECWKNSFNFMEEFYPDVKYDRYGYFANGLGAFESEEYMHDIIDISFVCHKAQKIVILSDSKYPQIYDKLFDFYQNFIIEIEKILSSLDFDKNELSTGIFSVRRETIQKVV